MWYEVTAPTKATIPRDAQLSEFVVLVRKAPQPLRLIVAF